MSELPPFAVLEPLLASIATVEHAGTKMQFLVANPFDLIQKHHAHGDLYEAEELALMAPFIPEGGTFVDIGANVGNHSVFAACHLRVGTVIAFEPGLVAHTILTVNKALNGLTTFDIRKTALSDRHGEMVLATPNPHNIGSSHLVDEGMGQRVPTARGDDLLAGRPVSFIKIDVEGHELAVLDGLVETLARTRPPLFIEVQDDNRPAFDAWAVAAGYHTEASYRRYSSSDNLLLLPASPPGPPVSPLPA